MLEGLETPKNQQFSCKVNQIAEGLEKSDTEIFLAACENPAWAAKSLSRALKERGVTISDTTILRHRRKECNCR